MIPVLVARRRSRVAARRRLHLLTRVAKKWVLQIQCVRGLGVSTGDGHLYSHVIALSVTYTILEQAVEMNL